VKPPLRLSVVSDASPCSGLATGSIGAASVPASPIRSAPRPSGPSRSLASRTRGFLTRCTSGPRVASTRAQSAALTTVVVATHARDRVVLSCRVPVGACQPQRVRVPLKATSMPSVGFEARSVPFDHSELEPGSHEVFVAKRPRTRREPQ
jgi:hypothetical protein